MNKTGSSQQEKEELINEGYLLKKKPGHKYINFINAFPFIILFIERVFEKRYFRIRNGFFYWYITHKSQNP